MGSKVDVHQVDRIRVKITKLLAGQGPDVQGAVLCDLLAIWLAGHAPALRKDLLDNHLACLPRLIAVNEAIMFGEAGHPAGRS